MSHNEVNVEFANGYYRSQDMTYVAITMPSEVAPDTIHAIGKMGKFHVVDLTSKEQPSKEYNFYKKHVADCVYWEKKLIAMATTMDEFKVQLPNASVDELKVARVLESVQEFLQPIEEELDRNQRFLDQNQQELSSFIEHQHVIRAFQDIEITGKIREAEEDAKGRRPSFNAPLLQADYGQELAEMKEGKRLEDKKDDFSFRKVLTGVIATVRQEVFKRMLYRISRGNAIAHFEPIGEPLMDPATGTPVDKSVFYVILLGEQTEQRISKMCGVFGATLYPIPADKKDFEAEIAAKAQEISYKKDVMEKTNAEIVRVLQQLAFDEKKSASPLKTWYHLVNVEKQVAKKFMRCHFYQATVVMEGWCPNKYLEDLRGSLRDAVKGSGVPPAAMEENPTSTIGVVGSPPTYFETNKFTSIFQGIVDTYGVPRYKEVNPGLFTIVTFPFLFGVMYGDIGHGALLTLFALAVLWKEKKLEIDQRERRLGDIEDMVFSGRYVLLLMGLFAIYCGFIYNDFFSIPTHLAESHWVYDEVTEEYSFTGRQVYPFGIDYEWYHKSNQLIFFNSVKMKLAVTLGVVQMTFGILLSLSNHIYFKDYISIFFEFLPRLIFMLCTFGYMIFLIIYKACIDWNNEPDRQPPSLIQTMIKMFLSPGKIETEDKLYDGQETVQVLFLILAIVSVPTMLCVKPCYNRFKHRHDANPLEDEHDDEESPLPRPYHSHEDDDDGEGLGERKEHKLEHKAKKVQAAGGGGHGHDGPYNFADDFIHTAIHTIEYVLGTVSNTASYLRLWALSLAHAELAEVFWSKMITEFGVDTKNIGMIFVGMAVWVGATFGVLMCMDVLECFLHALRLHWVEFQNKFYYADGYVFRPFTLDESEED